MLFSNVLDTKGGVCDGVSPSHGGDFLEIWVLIPGFYCIIMFRLSSILAEKVLGYLKGTG